ncbi:MAG TPA: hypothetical protein VGS41_18910, partial [Chthonomonadales bacterium]|nr:hypothetical protein [Chthonomonadales bacterium]
GEAFLRVLTGMAHARIDYPALAPAGGSGIAMEVVREDLRPEPPDLRLPLAEIEVGTASMSGSAAQVLEPGDEYVHRLAISGGLRETAGEHGVSAVASSIRGQSGAGKRSFDPESRSEPPADGAYEPGSAEYNRPESAH